MENKCIALQHELQSLQQIWWQKQIRERKRAVTSTQPQASANEKVKLQFIASFYPHLDDLSGVFFISLSSLLNMGKHFFFQRNNCKVRCHIEFHIIGLPKFTLKTVWALIRRDEDTILRYYFFFLGGGGRWAGGWFIHFE